MKSGFHPELVALEEKPEVQRADQNIPLNKFGIAGIDWVLSTSLMLLRILLEHFVA